MTAQASARAEPEPTHTERTYFLAIDDAHELNIAKAYVKAKYPNTLAKITNQLPLPRLGKDFVIIPLIRGEDRSPAVQEDRHQNGSSRVTHRRPLELISEVRECKPLNVADYWGERPDEWDAFVGELDRLKFMEGLAKSARPCIGKTHIGTPDLLRLTFI